MKKFAKISAVLAAMVLALAFVGCKDDDDDPSVVTTWAYTMEDEDGSATSTLYFYDDNTFKIIFSEGAITVTGATGTYTGDTTKDGNVVITIKKVVKGMLDDSESLELVDVPAEYASYFVWKATINGNTMTVVDTDETTYWIKK